jgi:hypothetical protein
MPSLPSPHQLCAAARLLGRIGRSTVRSTPGSEDRAAPFPSDAIKRFLPADLVQDFDKQRKSAGELDRSLSQLITEIGQNLNRQLKVSPRRGNHLPNRSLED